MEGIVYQLKGTNIYVKTSQGIVNCRPKGRLKQSKRQLSNLVVVGDRVTITFEPNASMGLITEVLPRKNSLVRKSVNLSRQHHVIAANIDLALILVTLQEPKTYTTFLDRILVATEAHQIQPLIVFNKIDTYGDSLMQQMQQLVQVYEGIGYNCLTISALKGINTLALKEHVKDKTVVITGVSGAGKSTVVKALDPSATVQLGALSEATSQGKHTTTSAQMFDLAFGARMIDTPGIKGFGITDIEKHELANYFPEFLALKAHCKFHNCLHLNEPDCAVLAALADNSVAKSRYESYLNLIQTFETGPYRHATKS